MRKYFLLFVAAAAAFAQTPLAFEVASVKPAAPLDPAAIAQGKMRIGMKVDGAILDIGSLSLRDLIRIAYEVKDYQISGPDWMAGMGGPRFNIQATLPEGATEKQVPQMLQGLLAERFKLAIHRDTKDHSVYALIVGKGGLKLKDAEPDPAAPETPPEPKKGETVMGQGANQVRMSGSMEGGKGMTVTSAATGKMQMSMVDGRMHMEAAKMNMTTFTEVLTRFVDRPVVDMTELKGNYRVALDLSMDDLKNAAKASGMAGAMGPGPGVEAGKAPADAASEPSGSSIFMSIQQMGLKLEARKAPLALIVIDHLEKSPTEN